MGPFNLRIPQPCRMWMRLVVMVMVLVMVMVVPTSQVWRRSRK